MADFFEISDVRLPPRFNIAPSQLAPIIRINDAGDRTLDQIQWGLVPHWLKDKASSSMFINARGETVHQKPAFRTAFRRRRCLVPADGFFEWKKMTGGKQPYFITLANQRLFAFAGIWDRVSREHTLLESFSIITCEPNEMVSEVHARMPVILPFQDYDLWLKSDDQGRLKGLLSPYRAEEMQMYPVSKLVNSPSNDGPECVRPLGEFS
jgi:putative SOS response-associated peptidase YedK